MARKGARRKKKADRTPDEWRDEIVAAMTRRVPETGWSDQSLKAAVGELELDPGIAELAFPEGMKEIVEAYLDGVDKAMMEALGKTDPDKLRVRERIATAIRKRLELHRGEKPLVERTVAWLALPGNADLSLRSLWRTSDLIWRWAGDTATDFNHYTKRAILSAVYSSTLLCWLQDESEGAEETWAFLERRIDNVMQFEKLKAKAREKAEKFPDLARELGRLRHGD